MNPISRTSLIHRFSRAWDTYDQAAEAQQHIAHTALTLLQEAITRHHLQPHHILEVGCGTGYFTHLIQPLFPKAQWMLNDLMPHARHILPSCLPGTQFTGGDILSCDFKSVYDLIVSTSVFQWIEDKVALVHNLSQWQPSGGLLLFTTFLPDNLHEIKELTGVGLAYPTQAAWYHVLSPLYEVDIMRQEELTLWFDSPLAVLQHLRHTGVTATNSTPWTPARLRRFCQTYEAHYRNAEGKVPLTYAPLYIRARRK